MPPPRSKQVVSAELPQVRSELGDGGQPAAQVRLAKRDGAWPKSPFDVEQRLLVTHAVDDEVRSVLAPANGIELVAQVKDEVGRRVRRLNRALRPRQIAPDEDVKAVLSVRPALHGRYLAMCGLRLSGGRPSKPAAAIASAHALAK